MRILIAEDDPITYRLLEEALTGWGYEVQVVCDGRTACTVLEEADPPQITLLDWMLPEMDGLEVCRRVRSTAAGKALHIIMLTGRIRKEDVVAGLDGGADDYITKPFDHEELRARVHAGRRIVDLQSALAKRMGELEDCIARITQLHGLLPMCAWCKKVRDGQNYWQEVESYIETHCGAHLTHGICPVCVENVKGGAG